MILPLRPHAAGANGLAVVDLEHGTPRLVRELFSRGTLSPLFIRRLIPLHLTPTDSNKEEQYYSRCTPCVRRVCAPCVRRVCAMGAAAYAVHMRYVLQTHGAYHRATVRVQRLAMVWYGKYHIMGGHSYHGSSDSLVNGNQIVRWDGAPWERCRPSGGELCPSGANSWPTTSHKGRRQRASSAHSCKPT